MDKTGVTLKPESKDHTGFSGNGPIITGSVGTTLARF